MDSTKAIVPPIDYVAVLDVYKRLIKNWQCPCCDNDTWTFIPPDSLAEPVRLTLPWVHPTEGPYIDGHGVSMAAFACSQCHYIRLHALAPVLREIAQGYNGGVNE